MKLTQVTQRGIAIITALMVAALVAAVATFMMWQYGLWLRQVENQHDLAQARVVAMGAVNLARFSLQVDARNNSVDHRGEAWAMPVASMPVENGEAGGQLSEEQGKFNLNNLAQDGQINENELAHFRRLLSQLQLNEGLANALADWLDKDSETRYPGGAEDMEYLAQPIPQRPANQPLADLSDLYRIQGFSPDVIQKLQPFVTALPESSQVNINFTSPQVLSSVVSGLDIGLATELLQSIQAGQTYDSVESLRQKLPTALANSLDLSALTVQSQFFRIEAMARFGRVRVGYTALLQRKGDQLPVIVWLERR